MITKKVLSIVAQPIAAVWHNGTTHLPPNDLKVLCCDRRGNFWVDWLLGGVWGASGKKAGDRLGWQVPALPVQIFFDLMEDQEP